jgi:Fic family protein
MLELARSAGFTFSEESVKRLHHLIYNGIDPEKAGQYRAGLVFITGTEYVPPTAEEVPSLMVALINALNAKRDKLYPVELAAYAHCRLTDIHPFQDGNGRTARLLMNLILVNKGYCIVSIPPVLRHDYITALQQAQRSNAPSDAAFVRLIAECEIEAQKDYCRMFRIKLPDLSKNAPER